MNFEKQNNNNVDNNKQELIKNNIEVLSKEELETIKLFIEVQYDNLKNGETTITDKDIKLFTKAQKYFRNRIEKIENIDSKDSEILKNKCKNYLNKINAFIRDYYFKEHGPYEDVIHEFKNEEGKINFRKFFDENKDKDYIIDFFKKFKNYELVDKNYLSLLNKEERYLIERSNPNMFI